MRSETQIAELALELILDHRRVRGDMSDDGTFHCLVQEIRDLAMDEPTDPRHNQRDEQKFDPRSDCEPAKQVSLRVEQF